MKGKKYLKWDIHHHIVPDFYVEEMKKMGMMEFNTLKWPKWTPESSLKMMNTLQIEKAFVSISAPGIFLKDAAYSEKLSRRCNEYIAKMVKDYPGRFGGFASVALPDVTSALREVEYALDILKLDGIGLMSNVNGKYLGDKNYREFYSELNKRNAIIYVHPNGITHRDDHRFLNPLYLWQNDTTRTVIDFIKSGYHRDYPNIRWILSHGGGILSPLYESIVQSLKDENPNIEAELKQWKSQVFLDTASKAYDEQIPQLLNFSDGQHVLFGSDIGWANKMAATVLIKSYSQLDEKLGLKENEIEDIFMGNAKRLFAQSKVPVSKENQTPIIIKDYKSEKQSKKIKYHYHCVPKRVVETIKSIEPSFELSDLKLWNEEETLEWMREEGYNKVMLSFDLPELWQMSGKDIMCILRVYNEEVSKIRNGNPQHFGAFGAVDINQPLHTISEIDYCLEELKLDGITLSTNINETKFDKFLDDAILKRLSNIKVPVMIHPQDSKGIPLMNENYLDAIYFMAKSFYLGAYARYLSNTQFILTHTDSVLPYVSQPINILFYMTVKKPRVWLYLIDNMVRNNPKGYKALMNMIVD
ncbi:amidohydrolase family protein [Clostridium sp. HMP27]|uniref:amidohydrolase family protein n=1 Tax=Clostridium sp. HMP27 TaxID=1487921 RepID=UPI000690BF80|nr:amidohydrolase family protein [Clostridium sp. HMP27]